uniref:Uncharacterized protein n=1 Tax=uncultured marine virus TaxID=186617 RepID=A0A0F7L9K9_9VIRU|nr:hypothetical protein [uncultured marine virus]
MNQTSAVFGITYFILTVDQNVTEYTTHATTMNRKYWTRCRCRNQSQREQTLASGLQFTRQLD